MALHEAEAAIEEMRARAPCVGIDLHKRAAAFAREADGLLHQQRADILAAHIGYDTHGFDDRAFGGSAQKLVMQALAAKKSSPDELAEIRKLLDELEGGKS